MRRVSHKSAPPPVPLPVALTRPLVFGDLEQIKALREYENALTEVKTGPREYEVTVTTIVTVEAYSEDEAREIAIEEAYGFRGEATDVWCIDEEVAA